MVTVYFETESYAEVNAIFNHEDDYIECLPMLEKNAKKHGFTKVTESVDDLDINDCVIEEEQI